MRYEIRVPKSAMPKKDPEHPCPCQFREFQIRDKKGEITEWLVDEGDTVKKGQIVCEGEVEKKTLEFASPADGILEKICLREESVFHRDDLLGIVRGED